MIPVITGLGAVSAAGVGMGPLRAALEGGRSALAEVEDPSLGPQRWPVGLVPGLAGGAGERGRVRQLALPAAREALAGGGWEDAAPERRALVLGTTCGGVHAVEALAQREAAGEPLPADLLAEMTFDAPTAWLAEALGAGGPAITVTLACASGTAALGYAADLLAAGRADVALVGGVDTVSAFILRGFAALRALGELPARVFDPASRGVILAEGAAFLLVEPLERARRRGAQPLAAILGCGTANDGYAISRPDPEGHGLARAVAASLDEAGLPPSAVEHVSAHGTGTRGGDLAEARALALALGRALPGIPISAIKPILGHSSGAAGALEAVAATLALSEGRLPPAPAPAPGEPLHPGLDVVRERSRPGSPEIVLSVGAGFGGSDAALVLGRPGARRARAPGRGGDATAEVWITGLGVALPGADHPAALAACAPPALAEVDRASVPLDFFRISGFIPSKESRRLDAFGQLVTLGIARALQDSGLQTASAPGAGGADAAIVAGSAFSCLGASRDYSLGLLRGRVNPVAFQNTVSNAALGYAAMLLGLRGPSLMISRGLLSGAEAVRHGAHLVRSGRAARAVVGGADVLSPWALARVEAAGGVPGGAAPISGAAFLVLEAGSVAAARGAIPYARLWAEGADPGCPPAPSAASRIGHPLGAVGPLEVAAAAWWDRREREPPAGSEVRAVRVEGFTGVCAVLNLEVGR